MDRMKYTGFAVGIGNGEEVGEFWILGASPKKQNQ